MTERAQWLRRSLEDAVDDLQCLTPACPTCRNEDFLNRVFRRAFPVADVRRWLRRELDPDELVRIRVISNESVHSRLVAGLRAISAEDIDEHGDGVAIVIAACRAAGLDTVLQEIAGCPAEQLIRRTLSPHSTLQEDRECGRATALSKVIAYCSAEGRICPNPGKWHELYKLISEDANATQQGLWRPLILGAWNEATNQQKRTCLRQQLEWANAHDRLRPAWKFIRRLPNEDWYSEVPIDS